MTRTVLGSVWAVSSLTALLLSGCGKSNAPDGSQSSTGTGVGGASSTSGNGGAPSGATIAINPPSATVMPSGTATFSCVVTGLNDTSCDWSVKEGTTGGTISSSGLYTAPSAGGAYHVIAAAHAEPSVRATATVVVPAPAGDCSNLAAVGVLEDVTPAALHDPPNIETFAVAVNPLHPNIVFASGGNVTNPQCPTGATCPKTGTGIYMSSNCGKDFELLSTGPNHVFLNGNLWNIRIDPVEPNIMYTMNGYGSPASLFKSTDSGATWTDLFTSSDFTTPQNQGGTFLYGGFVRSFDIDAGDPKHLVVAFHEDCYGAVAAKSSDAVNGAVMCLAESRDGGATWSLFEGPIPPSSADGGAPVILSSNALIYANSGDPLGNTVWYTADPKRATSSWKPVLTYNQSGGFGAINSSGFYIDPGGTLYLPGGSGIVASAPGPSWGQSWTLIPNSPTSQVLSGDGRSADQGGFLFASLRVYPTGMRPIYKSPLSMLGTTFGTFDTPSDFVGVSGMSYDVVHHILYGAAGTEGIRRMVTY